MVIKLREIPESVFPAFKCGEKEFRANMFTDGTNRMFKGRLIPGASIGEHIHDDSCEIIFILSGKGHVLELENQEFSYTEVHPGDCIFCGKGKSHSLKNTSEDEDLIFYAAVIAQ